MSSPYIIPPLEPADIEDLPIWYYTPILAPTPVDSRLPSPANDRDTVNGFLRIESADSTRSGLDCYDLNFIFHAYSPIEAEASDISKKVGAYASSALGQNIMSWYVIHVPTVIFGRRLSDPDIPLPRYRGAVTWRVQGHPY
jgi:hypothetical protein